MEPLVLKVAKQLLPVTVVDVVLPVQETVLLFVLLNVLVAAAEAVVTGVQVAKVRVLDVLADVKITVTTRVMVDAEMVVKVVQVRVLALVKQHVLAHALEDAQILVLAAAVLVPPVVLLVQEHALEDALGVQGVADHALITVRGAPDVVLAQEHVQEDVQDVMTSVMLLVSNHVLVVQDALDAVLLVGQAALLHVQILVLEHVVIPVLRNAEHVVHLVLHLVLRIVATPVQALVMVA